MARNLTLNKKFEHSNRTLSKEGDGEIKGYLITKAYLILFVLAAILVVFTALGFGTMQARNGVCSRIAEEVGTQKDRLVFIIEDLCGSAKSRDKNAGR